MLAVSYNDDATMTSEPGSISILLQRLKFGDQRASSEIWKRYIERLLPLARKQLRGLRDPVVDEEDLLLSVFDRFFKAAQEERFAKLENREDLWQVLLVLTERRATDQYRRTNAQKRGGPGGRDEGDAAAGGHVDDILEFAERGPTPEFAVIFADQLETALCRIQEPSTQEAALLRMEGYELKEIAEKLGISLSSVKRKLRVVRDLWSQSFFD